jgi:hypothetical protein
LLLDLEWGEGAEALGVSKDGVLRLILVVAADEGAVEARQGVHGWRGRVVGAEEEVTRRGELEWDGSGTRPPGPDSITLSTAHGRVLSQNPVRFLHFFVAS